MGANGGRFKLGLPQWHGRSGGTRAWLQGARGARGRAGRRGGANGAGEERATGSRYCVADSKTAVPDWPLK